MELNIILEGGDLGGKTTLANYLNETYPQLEIVRFGKPENTECWFQQCDNSMKLLKRGGVIMDRLPMLSNFIYRPIFKHPYGCKEIQVFHWMSRIPEPTLILFLGPPHSVIFDRFNTRGDEYLNFAQIIEAHVRYYRFYRNYPGLQRVYKVKCPPITYINHGQTVREGLDVVKAFKAVYDAENEVKKQCNGQP